MTCDGDQPRSRSVADGFAQWWARANSPIPGLPACSALVLAGLAFTVWLVITVSGAIALFLVTVVISPLICFMVAGFISLRSSVHPVAGAISFAAIPALCAAALAVRQFWPGMMMGTLVLVDGVIIYGGLTGSRGLAAWRAGPRTHCLKCGYSLAGLGPRGRCPECGWAFRRPADLV